MPDGYLNLQVHTSSGLSFPWAEYTPKGRGTTLDGSFGHDGGGATAAYVIVVPWEYAKVAVPELVGYSRRVEQADGTYALSRVLPFRHPYFQSLWCSRIAAIQPLAWRDLNMGDGTGPYSDYQAILFTLQFTRPPYSVLPDTNKEVVDKGESRRFTDRFWKPTVQTISREGMGWAFSAGRPNGKQFTGNLGARLGKAYLQRTWYQLPEDAVYDENGLPDHLLFDDTDPNNPQSRLCTVNASDFQGMPAYTLLLQNFEITPRPLPFPLTFPPILANLPFAEYYPLQYDVTFYFEYFDPPRGWANPDPDDTTLIDERGHNLAPWPADNRWYPVASLGYSINGVTQGAGQRPFLTSDFTQLWTVRQ